MRDFKKVVPYTASQLEADVVKLNFGVEVGDLVKSCYNDTYQVTAVSWVRRKGLPVLQGRRVGLKGKFLTDVVIINYSLNTNGKVKIS